MLVSMPRLLHAVLQHNATRFIALGGLNTVLDFLILNVLLRMLPSYAASKTGLALLNVVSASIVIIFSYFMNKRFVFGRGGKSSNIAGFFIVTAIGLFGVQTLIILLVRPLIEPVISALCDQSASGIVCGNQVAVINNLAKIAATAGSMIWNYFMYSKLVFRLRPPADSPRISSSDT